jgi:hypothetical protein
MERLLSGIDMRGIRARGRAVQSRVGRQGFSSSRAGKSGAARLNRVTENSAGGGKFSGGPLVPPTERAGRKFGRRGLSGRAETAFAYFCSTQCRNQEERTASCVESRFLSTFEHVFLTSYHLRCSSSITEKKRDSHSLTWM